MNVLHPVRLTKKDSCFTYALKRTGQRVHYDKAESIPNDCLLPFDFTILNIGSIIVWKSSKKQYTLIPTEITSFNGKPVIINNLEFTGYHLAVVENIVETETETIIIFSDCVRNENAHSFPSIKLGQINISKIEEKEYYLPTYIYIP